MPGCSACVVILSNSGLCGTSILVWAAGDALPLVVGMEAQEKHSFREDYPAGVTPLLCLCRACWRASWARLSPAPYFAFWLVSPSPFWAAQDPSWSLSGSSSISASEYVVGEGGRQECPTRRKPQTGNELPAGGEGGDLVHKMKCLIPCWDPVQSHQGFSRHACPRALPSVRLPVSVGPPEKKPLLLQSSGRNLL